MSVTEGKVITRDRLPAPRPREHRAPRPRRVLTAASPEVIAARLAGCADCHFNHEGKCRKRCCGPLARSIDKAVRFVEIRCPLRRPRW